MFLLVFHDGMYVGRIVHVLRAAAALPVFGVLLWLPERPCAAVPVHLMRQVLWLGWRIVWRIVGQRGPCGGAWRRSSRAAKGGRVLGLQEQAHCAQRRCGSRRASTGRMAISQAKRAALRPATSGRARRTAAMLYPVSRCAPSLHRPKCICTLFAPLANNWRKVAARPPSSGHSTAPLRARPPTPRDAILSPPSVPPRASLAAARPVSNPARAAAHVHAL